MSTERAPLARELTRPLEHVMLDLETMGTGPDAAIVQIGAVGFNGDWPSLSPYTESFFCRISLTSAMAAGGVADASTILWWMRQSESARAGIFATVGVLGIGQALDDFSAWWKAQCDRKTLLWGNGADFDNVILASAYRRAGKEQPWGAFNNRCFRTLKAESGIAYERPKLAHDALADASAQAEHWLKIRAIQRNAGGAT